MGELIANPAMVKKNKEDIASLNSNITKITLPTKITCSSQNDFESKATTLAGTLQNGEIASVVFGFPSGMIFNGTTAWGYINKYSANRWNMVLTSYDDETYVVNIQYNVGTIKYTDLNSKLTKCSTNSILSDSISPNSNGTVTIDMPTGATSILSIVPYGFVPADHWGSQVSFTSSDPSTRIIGFRCIGSGNAQKFSIKYIVFYK